MNLKFENSLAGKKIFVTGHTGFMGGWVSLWLKSIDAEVMGYSLPPENPSLFSLFMNNGSIHSVLDDICNYETLLSNMERFKPDMILHFAAQALVRKGYRYPRDTFAVNTLGTVNVLEAARSIDTVKAVVCVTTDKVYENHERPEPYRETDPLGGKDPYSASKSAAEMVIRSYNYLKGPPVAAIRGGNIIGGGDWCEDRLIPDFVRAIQNKSSLDLRYPHAVRPWQHVLGLSQGCLMVLAGLGSENSKHFARPWNFGPLDSKTFTVSELIELMSAEWERPTINFLSDVLPEAHTLKLDSSMAKQLLNWVPPWNTERSIKETIAWYKTYFNSPSQIERFTLDQIKTWRSEVAACM